MGASNEGVEDIEISNGSHPSKPGGAEGEGEGTVLHTSQEQVLG